MRRNKMNIKLNITYYIFFILTLIILSGSGKKASAETYQFELKWGSTGSGDGQFNSPRGIAVDVSGNVYVADNNRIQKFRLSSGFTISTINGIIIKNNTLAIFTVKLDTQPTANVTIPISSSNTSLGTVSPASLVFTPTNWNVNQTVKVTGVNNYIVDGNQNYTIILGKAISDDVNYYGLDPADVSVTNIDDNNVAGNIDTTSPGSSNRVDGHDVYLFSLAFGCTPASTDWNSACDFNGDSIINGDDLVLLAANFGKKN